MDTKASRRNEVLRAMLHGMRKQVVGDIESQMGRRLGDAGLAQIDSAMDSGDRAVLDLSDSVDVALLGMRYRHYKEIADAFRRLEDGTYGRCERCAVDIPLQRLEVDPAVQYCVPCRAHSEVLERIEQEEQRFKTAAPPAHNKPVE